ncbi:MAG: homoserine O-acetyltransferase [Bacteroidota bacterium]
MTKTNYTIPVHIEGLQFYHHDKPIALESGAVLPEVTIAYHTYGKLNEEKNNVIWVCHALTANSHVADWWEGLYGSGNVFDPEKYFIVCANVLGSCYGTTCPRSISPKTKEAYGIDFPIVTIRDWVQCHELLRQHLQIGEIELCIGGSCGGHQVMEFAYVLKDKIKSMALLVTSAKETPWAISTHEAQRLAIQADATWRDNVDHAGKNGLKAARGMALLTYRTFRSYKMRQTDTEEKLDDFRAASYIRYQGHKLERRFYAQSYWHMVKTLDTHDMGRGRGGAGQALQQLKMPALIISVNTDMLIPPEEQQFLHAHLSNSTYKEITSEFGHDGFLVETEKIKRAIMEWREKLFEVV